MVYQIYPRSFADGDADGVGDLRGIRHRLDHLAWLGIDAIWLSPIFRSPMADFGYDVADYCDIDPIFGDLAEFDRLVADCHARGIRVVLDWVPNHTSIEHPWFVESRSSRDNPKRDWYVWRDLGPDGAPPNNWRAAFAVDEPAWTLDPTTGQAYLHCFLPEQPDLNWDHPEVEAAMLDTLRFWLDRGVDGFRMDVVHLIGKDLDTDDPASAGNHVPHNDVASTHERLRRIRLLLDSYEGDRTSVGEVYLLDEAAMATYYGQDDELHLSFNFPFLWASWDAGQLRRRIDRTLEHLTPRQAWPTWVLSNHDVPRHRQRYGGSEAIARQAAVLLLTLPGTPFMYQGEELGLIDAVVPDDRIVDPGGRDGCRAPIPWTAGCGSWLGSGAVAAVPARGVRAQRRATGRRSRLDRPPLPAHARPQAVQCGAALRRLPVAGSTGRRARLRAVGRGHGRARLGGDQHGLGGPPGHPARSRHHRAVDRSARRGRRRYRSDPRHGRTRRAPRMTAFDPWDAPSRSSTRRAASARPP